jgi:hypothetical protein
MSKRTTDFAFIVGGVSLWYVGAKTFADYHEAVATGRHDTFQQRHATAIGTATSLAGLGLAVYGTWRLNKTLGIGLGSVLGAVVAYNVVKHKKGEPLITLSPFSPKFSVFTGNGGEVQAGYR